MERGVKYSSPGLLVELFQGRGLNFFLVVKLGPKKFEGGSNNSSRGLPDDLSKGRGDHFFLVAKLGQKSFEGGKTFFSWL